jgi:hypothetical protein
MLRPPAAPPLIAFILPAVLHAFEREAVSPQSPRTPPSCLLERQGSSFMWAWGGLAGGEVQQGGAAGEAMAGHKSWGKVLCRGGPRKACRCGSGRGWGGGKR